MAEITAQLAAWTAGCILLTAVATKVTDVRGFAERIRGYRLLPESGSVVLAITLLAAEVIVGISLLLGILLPAVLVLASALFAGYAIVATTELLAPSRAGGPADCACLGSNVPLKLGWTHVSMNVTVAVASMLAVFVDHSDAVDAITRGVLLVSAISLAALYWLLVYASSVRSVVEDAITQKAESIP